PGAAVPTQPTVMRPGGLPRRRAASATPTPRDRRAFCRLEPARNGASVAISKEPMELPALEATEQAASAQALGQWVSDLVSLTKPRLSSLVLCTLAGGMWLAPGALPVSKWLGTLLGTALLVG